MYTICHANPVNSIQMCPTFSPAKVMPQKFGNLILTVVACLDRNRACFELLRLSQICFPVSCLFWRANGCLASCLQFEIIFLGILTPFSVTKGKKRKRHKKWRKSTQKGVYQCVDATPKRFLTPVRIKFFFISSQNIWKWIFVKVLFKKLIGLVQVLWESIGTVIFFLAY